MWEFSETRWQTNWTKQAGRETDYLDHDRKPKDSIISMTEEESLANGLIATKEQIARSFFQISVNN